MKLVLRLLVLVVLLPAARAQCRVLTAPTGRADVDGGRAILSSIEAFDSPQHVHFYAKRADGWRLEQTAVVGTAGLIYLAPVAMDGDRAIAGAPETDFLTGRAYVFDLVGERWIPTRLEPVGVGYVDLFGASVDVSGDIAIVGASHDAVDAGDGLGRVHVFEFDGSGWRPTAELLAYGDSIDIEGETVAIGQGRYIDPRVQVFRKVSGVWTWVAELRPPMGSGEVSHEFGRSVALLGENRIAVGNPQRTGSVGPGAVHVLRETVQGWWVHDSPIEARQGSYGDSFGTSLAWSGTDLYVGARGRMGSGNGKVHRLRETGGGFVEVERIVADANEDEFGYAVGEGDGDVVVVSFTGIAFYRFGIAEAAPFCDQPFNSTGFPGLLSVKGCDSLTGRMLTLHGSQIPPHALVRPFLGGSLPPLAFGDGFRCVGNPLYRLPAATSDALGEVRTPFDFDSPGGGYLQPGGAASFQLLYRDRGSPLSGFNLTNAVGIGVTP